jgi:hypothetical protein
VGKSVRSFRFELGKATKRKSVALARFSRRPGFKILTGGGKRKRREERGEETHTYTHTHTAWKHRFTIHHQTAHVICAKQKRRV